MGRRGSILKPGPASGRVGGRVQPAVLVRERSHPRAEDTSALDEAGHRAHCCYREHAR
jgi:hypothetical protein